MYNKINSTATHQICIVLWIWCAQCVAKFVANLLQWPQSFLNTLHACVQSTHLYAHSEQVLHAVLHHYFVLFTAVTGGFFHITHNPYYKGHNLKKNYYI